MAVDTAGDRRESACSAALHPRRGAVAPARPGILVAPGRGQEREPRGSCPIPPLPNFGAEKDRALRS